MKVERCPLCKQRKRRSNEQNRRYWALLHLLSERLKPRGQQFSAETFHLWAKSKWLGCQDFILPNGKTLVIPNNSSDLDTPEFNDYMTAVEAWANERGIYLEDSEAA